MQYQAALKEIDEILTALREGKVGIDELENRVNRAEELIRYCRERLRNVETQLDELNNGVESTELF